jgi:hypothetical protein
VIWSVGTSLAKRSRIDHPLRPVDHGDKAIDLLKPLPFDLEDLPVGVFAAPFVFKGMDT